MSDFWTVKGFFTPMESPNGPPALLNGATFSFIEGEKLSIDLDKTQNEEKENVLIRVWFWLFDGDRAGFVPFNPENPDDFASVARPWNPSIPAPPEIGLFKDTVTTELFAEGCVRKAIRWQTNAAYLLALAFVESGDQWPDGEVSSPAAKPGQFSIGTFQFMPATWKTLVERLGQDQKITANDSLFPQAQTTFAAIQAADAFNELTKRLGNEARYVDLYMAHLFTIEGCIKINQLAKDESDDAISQKLSDILSHLDPTSKENRISTLQQRKAPLLTHDGTETNARQLTERCVSELNLGLDFVREVADTLIGDAITAGDTPVSQKAGAEDLGVLSEEFESNGNDAAIGFDSTGGFSYGRYQIATKTGTFDKFMSFLEGAFPSIATVLKNAGGAAAARAGTDVFKSAWKGLKNDKDFYTAQKKFIGSTHYEVMVKKLKTLVDINTQPIAIQNVVWSTAVQHGPNSKIISLCVRDVGAADPAKLINRVYNERSKVDKYFRSSKASIKKSVLKRFAKERKLALAML